MALPSSGQISFNDVRIEMSQSAKAPYEMGAGWTWGGGVFPTIICSGVGYEGYAPINVLSSGSRFSESSPLRHQNLSMSAWYNYDHTLYIGLDVTGTLYQHASIPDYCYPSTMLIVDVGTTNTTLSFNISGTLDYPGNILAVFYGKPWLNDGGSNYPFLPIWADVGYFGNVITQSFFYNYEYHPDSGSKLYWILANGCNA
jgi:hypothetical protein